MRRVASLTVVISGNSAGQVDAEFSLINPEADLRLVGHIYMLIAPAAIPTEKFASHSISSNPSSSFSTSSWIGDSGIHSRLHQPLLATFFYLLKALT
jgi:hypothetical protein